MCVVDWLSTGYYFSLERLNYRNQQHYKALRETATSLCNCGHLKKQEIHDNAGGGVVSCGLRLEMLKIKEMVNNHIHCVYMYMHMQIHDVHAVSQRVFKEMKRSINIMLI